MITIDDKGKLTSDKKYWAVQSTVQTEIIRCKCGKWLALYGVYSAPDGDVSGLICTLWGCHSCNQAHDTSKDALERFRLRERQFKEEEPW